jgi:hypothetical protein
VTASLCVEVGCHRGGAGGICIRRRELGGGRWTIAKGVVERRSLGGAVWWCDDKVGGGDKPSPFLPLSLTPLLAAGLSRTPLSRRLPAAARVGEAHLGRAAVTGRLRYWEKVARSTTRGHQLVASVVD